MKIKINSKVLIAILIVVIILVSSSWVFAYKTNQPYLNGHPAESIVGLIELINQAISSLNIVYQVQVPAGCLTPGQYATGIQSMSNGVNGKRVSLKCSVP